MMRELSGGGSLEGFGFYGSKSLQDNEPQDGR